MIATSRFEMTDLSRQKRLSVELAGELTPGHTVDQAVLHFLHRLDIPDHGLPWNAYSRGVVLDKKARLSDVAEEDRRWTVLPEVSAGAH
jgi:hypothetical protein